MQELLSTRFLDPLSVITQAGISSGEKVADFGCASGYFSLPIARIVGDEGRVLAVDVLPHVLENVLATAKKEGLSNLQIYRANLESEIELELPANSIDWVVLKDVLFMNHNKKQMLLQAYRILHDGGKILVVEWNENIAGVGPTKELRVNESDLKQLAEDVGFGKIKSLDAGKYHYAFVAVK